MIAPLLALGLLLAQAEPPAAEAHPLKGTVGMCVRWGADSQHVSDAVVVVPSGNPLLDEGIGETIKAMTLERPADAEGVWVGLSLSIEGGEPPKQQPDCSSLNAAGDAARQQT